MLWIALLPHTSAPEARSQPETPLATAAPPQDLQALAWWALSLSPRVACEGGAVLLEVQASLRLLGGEPGLLRRCLAQARALGVDRIGLAPTALAALALARSLPPGLGRLRRATAGRWLAVLHALPVALLDAAVPHVPLLLRLGCATLGDLAALPSAGLARRFGPGLRRALEQAEGRQPHTLDWVTLPEVFDERLACPSLVESAPGLLFGARRLLARLDAWLAGRQWGVRRLALAWEHDPRRGVAASGGLEVGTAQAGQGPAHRAHLERLLAEQLARVSLPAPVQAMSLRALEVEPWAPDSGSLLPEDQRQGEPLALALERVAARLGPEHVLAGTLEADHRPQHMQGWSSAVQGPGVARRWVAPARAPGARPPWPGPVASQPPWLLPRPWPLQVRDERPQFQGPLTRLAGPERIEAGWWPGAQPCAEALAGPGDLTLRDYFIARSPRAGLLWVYRLRQPGGAVAHWFLHGVFG